MKHSRKLIALVLAFATLLLSGCLAPDDPIEHVHIFDMKVTSDDMRATEATCTERPTYYFSCRCGEKSDKTFVYGDTLPHTFDQAVAEKGYAKGKYNCTKPSEYYHSCICGAKGTTTFTGDESTVKAHVYTADCDTFCDECGTQRKAPAAHGELDGYKCTVCGTEPRRENWTEMDDFTKN